MNPTPDDTSPTNTIDALLERYLLLLDEYTSLRAELSRLQTATFQHLARANFAAERGVRYGSDFYDQRMQAVRTVEIASDEEDEARGCGGIVFQVVTGRGTAAASSDAATDGAGAGKEQSEEPAQEQTQAHQKQKTNKDPLRWFGVLTPLALRQTQASAVDVLQRVVPRLVTVDAAMRDLEIEVRRARKRRAKAEASAASAKTKQEAEAGRDRDRAIRGAVVAS